LKLSTGLLLKYIEVIELDNFKLKLIAKISAATYLFLLIFSTFTFAAPSPYADTVIINGKVITAD